MRAYSALCAKHKLSSVEAAALAAHLGAGKGHEITETDFLAAREAMLRAPAGR